MKFLKQVIFAHRGASGLVKHENTMEAFEKSVELKADGIELDIRKTKDQKIVVIHNDSINDLKICDLTYDEIKKITLRENYIIPLFEDVLKFSKSRILLDIEVKESGYEKEIIDLVLKYLKYDEFYLRSFHKESVKLFKELDKNITTVLLLGGDNGKGFKGRCKEIFPNSYIKYTKCDIISPHYRLLLFGFIKRMHIKKIPVIVWTVNEEKRMYDILHKKKADGIITNFPNIGLEILNKK